MNTWLISYYNPKVQEWIKSLPVGLRASYARLSNLLIEFGIDLRLPYARTLGDGLFELRLHGKEGIARIFYCTLVKKQIVILHGFVKKTQKIPKKELKIAHQRMKEVSNAQKN